LFFLVLIRPPPRSPLFPYTTLFRSTRTRRYSRSRVLRADPPADLGWTAPGTPGPRHAGSTPASRHGRPCHHPRGREPRPSLGPRSEEHTSELQSRENLVCRLLLEKK